MTTTTTTPTATTATTPVTQPADRPPSPWDAWVVAGLTVVALTAFVASFSTLANLASVAGWGERARWLLPCCIDALALAAARVWLSGRAPEPARRYARVVALAAVAASVLGNAVGHLVGSGYLRSQGTAGVVLVILVGSVPAVALGAVAHLATLAGVPVKAKVKTRRTRTSDTPPATDDGTSGSRAATVPPSRTSAATPGTAPRSKTERTGKQPSARARAAGRGSENQNKARALWDAEHAAGRTPSGAELARAAGVDPSMGRRWRRDWETADTAAEVADHPNSIEDALDAGATDTNTDETASEEAA